MGCETRSRRAVGYAGLAAGKALPVGWVDGGLARQGRTWCIADNRDTRAAAPRGGVGRERESERERESARESGERKLRSAAWLAGWLRGRARGSRLSVCDL